MWLINLLPDGIVTIIFYISVAVLALSYVLEYFPIPFKSSILPIHGLSLILVCTCLWIYGAKYNEHIWKDRVATLEKKLEDAKKESGKVNTVIEYKFIDRVVKVKETQWLVQQRIQQVSEKIDGQCKITPETVSILNTSAAGIK